MHFSKRLKWTIHRTAFGMIIVMLVGRKLRAIKWMCCRSCQMLRTILSARTFMHSWGANERKRWRTTLQSMRNQNDAIWVTSCTSEVQKVLQFLPNPNNLHPLSSGLSLTLLHHMVQNSPCHPHPRNKSQLPCVLLMIRRWWACSQGPKMRWCCGKEKHSKWYDHIQHAIIWLTLFQWKYILWYCQF